MLEEGYTLFEGTSEGTYRDEGRILEAFRDHGVAGAIVAPVVEDASDLSHLFLIQRRGYPLVLLGEIRGLPVPSVTVDNVRAAKAAVRYLIEGGHERILHVSGPAYSQHSQDRVAGVKEAFSESALRFHDGMVVEGGASLEDGYRVVQEVFGRDGERPTAVTCFNDLVAIGALRALAELGLSVPGDVSVVGYDDIDMAAYLPTPLTTVHVPSREMGRRAAALLLRQLERRRLRHARADRARRRAGGPRHIPFPFLMPTTFETRYATGPDAARTFDTEALRETFLIPEVMVPGEVRWSTPTTTATWPAAPCRRAPRWRSTPSTRSRPSFSWSAASWASSTSARRAPSPSTGRTTPSATARRST